MSDLIDMKALREGRQLIDARDKRRQGGNGKAAGKSLTQAVKEAERSAAKCNEALVEMRELARSARDTQADVRARIRRAVWTVGAVCAATVGSCLYALARLGAL